MTGETFEDRIFGAVVAQFFAPDWQMVSVFNPSTNQTEQILQQFASPAARLANDMFTAQRDRILEVVKERIDVAEIADALASRITEDVVNRMTQTGLWNNFDRDREEMRRMVNARIADELARRALEKMDAEQADADAPS